MLWLSGRLAALAEVARQAKHLIQEISLLVVIAVDLAARVLHNLALTLAANAGGATRLPASWVEVSIVLFLILYRISLQLRWSLQSQ